MTNDSGIIRRAMVNGWYRRYTKIPRRETIGHRGLICILGVGKQHFCFNGHSGLDGERNKSGTGNFSKVCQYSSMYIFYSEYV